MKDTDCLLANNARFFVQEEYRKYHQASWRRRIAFWWMHKRVAFYKFFNLDYSKVVGYPMTRREYRRWQKVGSTRHFKCDGYEVCSCLNGLSPHLPIGECWMACRRDSGHGFECGVTTLACLPESICK